jgi:hypothetical protein
MLTLLKSVILTARTFVILSRFQAKDLVGA